MKIIIKIDKKDNKLRAKKLISTIREELAYNFVDVNCKIEIGDD